MWISRKHYNFLIENAEKNLDAECEIMRLKDEYAKSTARAFVEYSKVLEERDELKDRICELENIVEQFIKDVATNLWLGG